jgi:hypothetical protein
VKIYTLKNALIFPAIGQAVYYKSSILGVQSEHTKKDPKDFGLMSFSNCHTNKRLRRAYAKKNIPEKIHGCHLYLGHLNYHFGHFMEECLGRIWACKKYNTKVDSFIFIVTRNNVELKPFILEIFHLFNINVNKIKLVSQFVTVENLIVPESASWFGAEKDWFQDWLKKYIVLSEYKKKPYPKIIIRRSKNFLGRVAGFDYFSNILVNNGFREVYPENYTVKQQIEFIVSAKTIIWEQGSACHLLKILPKLKGTSILIRRDLYAPAIENLIKSKFDHVLIYRDVESLFSINKWYVNKNMGNSIMATFKYPKKILTFFLKNNLINESKFEETIFNKAEKKDLLYFYINYFFLTFLIKYIKPLVPKFIWIKLKTIKNYFLGRLLEM